jgi:meiotically up-regulated gene 157 (Mug157) protein
MKDDSRRERLRRREVLLGAGAWSLMQAGAGRAFAEQATAAPPNPTPDQPAVQTVAQAPKETAPPKLPHARPPVADRRFTSSAVEDAIATLQHQIGDPALRVLVENCLPNTLDTTVYPGAFDKHPDTYVVTGDIDAMWLRDSSAQVWPYLRLALKDARLRILLEGVIRRQTRMIHLDPYANAFTRETADPPLSWAVSDHTEHRAGVAERKWEIDSLCFPIRLAYGYWQTTRDAGPFDAQWRAAADAILRTFTEQQRKHSQGPYSFQRKAESPYDTQGLSGFGNPAEANGMIFSMFRP